jgi:sulfonate transport system permease protein
MVVMVLIPADAVHDRAEYAALTTGAHEIAMGASDLVRVQPLRRREGVRIPRAVRRMFGPLIFLFLWWLFTKTGVLSTVALAPPQSVAKAGWHLIVNGELISAIWASLQRVLWGFLIGGVIGITLALLAGLFRLGEDLVDATMGMLRTVPWVGLIPLFVVWFGIGESPKIALVALGVTFPLYINTYAGIRNVDAGLVETGTSLGLGRWKQIRHVVLPGALPGLLVGLRYSLGIAWLALVFAEQINASNGIGYLMNNAENYFETNVIIFCLVVYAVLGLTTDLIVRLLIRFLLPWRTSYEGT